MYNQHTRGMATSRHRSLVERGGRKALLETLHTPKTRQNGENVNPLGAIASVVGDQSGPWTGWIDPAPV